MNAGGLLERSDQLPPLPASAADARRIVRDTLLASTAAHTDLVDTAVLLVSEVVTNAVLHAGTGIDIRVIATISSVRVEVTDGSVVLPSRRAYDDDASTGRGLDLVEILASAWGTGLVPGGGKVVWFELGCREEVMDSVHGVRRDAPATGGPTTGAASESRVVRFIGLPVALVLATLEYGDAVLREIALASVYVNRTAGPSAKTLDLGPLLGPVSSAHDEGKPIIDVEVTFPVEAAAAARNRMVMIDDAHRLALDGQLLALPAVPEIMMCRRWLLGEIHGQIDGKAPTAWELPAPVELDQRLVPLSAEERAEVEAMGATMVVGDDSNRIIHASENVEELLGWPADELFGRRLTAIIPPDLRERHLVGFTRYQMTGDGPILGKPVSVPALKRDGTIVQVEITIDVHRRRSGDRMFCARFSEDPGPQDAPIGP